MINKSTRPPSISVRRQSLTIAVLLTLAVVLLLVQFGSLVAWDAKAIRYPFGLEYGEGMVWQQMRLILSGHAYGPIQDVPAIVFQYPPLYYLVVGGLSRATSWDELACGRLVSVAAAGFVLLFAALIVFQALRRECQARAALACAIVCALAIASFIPMQRFSALMRVDMTALAFSFAGVFLGLRALNRPRLVHFAAICFVASVFTKQTFIAAPASTFLTLLILRPRIGVAGLVTTVILGGSTLIILVIITNGGILRHNFLYNANSIHGANLKKLIPLSMYVGYIYVVIRNCLPLFRNYIIRTPQDLKYSSLTSLRQGFKYKAALLLFMIYFALSTIMLLMILKSGGSINYFIEWSCVLGVLFGLFLGDTAMVAFASNDDPPKGNIGDVAPLSLIAAAVALQAAVLAFGPNSASLWPARDPSESRQLIEEIARAKRPVISDDMVALLRAGKPVLWEPAIQQLARDGVWSERPFIELIASHEFAFFVTDGDEGDELFEERYTPAIAEAIRQAYPAKRTLGGYTLHFE